MRTGIYICTCTMLLSEKLDVESIRKSAGKLPGVAYVQVCPSLCSAEGVARLIKDIRKRKPERIVFAACSPRNHEEVLQGALEEAQINPNFMQIANIREQAAWVTQNRTAATRKALALIKAAGARVSQHGPSEKKAMEVCPDIMVIGAGPAGLSAARVLAEAGRKVVLIEKSPSPGGMPMMFDEIFPDRTCGPCLMQPMIDAVLHAEGPGAVELLTMAQVRSVRGSFGSHEICIEQSPRFIDPSRCIGCGECVKACPVSLSPVRRSGASRRKAVDFSSSGAMPHIPYIDAKACRRLNGKNHCSACVDSCPVDGAIRFDDSVRVHRRTVGAVVLATGASLFESSVMPALGQGRLSGVMTSLAFERMLATDGPTKGAIRGESRRKPDCIVIVQCVGSLDAMHREYCSSICCRYALKYRAMIRERLPDTRIVHLVKEWCLPGQEAQRLFRPITLDRKTTVFRYRTLSALKITSDSVKKLSFEDDAGKRHRVSADLVVLCPAVVPHHEASALAGLFGVTTDESGFFRDDGAEPCGNGGVETAGACRAPGDIRTVMEQGRAAAGRILSRLHEGAVHVGRTAGVSVDPERCSGCMLCVGICPAKAIDSEGKIVIVRDLLCTGCGICVAACPAGAMQGGRFSSQALSAELKGLLEHGEK